MENTRRLISIQAASLEFTKICASSFSNKDALIQSAESLNQYISAFGFDGNAKAILLRIANLATAEQIATLVQKIQNKNAKLFLLSSIPDFDRSIEGKMALFFDMK